MNLERWYTESFRVAGGDNTVRGDSPRTLRNVLLGIRASVDEAIARVERHIEENES